MPTQLALNEKALGMKREGRGSSVSNAAAAAEDQTRGMPRAARRTQNSCAHAGESEAQDDGDFIWRIPEFCQRYRVSRGFAYAEIKAGRLTIVKMGRSTGIRRRDARAWANALPTVGAA